MTEYESQPMFDLSCQPLCMACSGETRTIYVHFCSGTLLKIANARKVGLTKTDIIIECGDGHAVEFRRSDVYFTSCENCVLPFSD